MAKLRCSEISKVHTSSDLTRNEKNIKKWLCLCNKLRYSETKTSEAKKEANNLKLRERNFEGELNKEDTQRRNLNSKPDLSSSNSHVKYPTNTFKKD